MEGIKYDDGKRQWDLLPFESVNEVLKVLEYGAKKYAPNNWQKVEPKTRYINAAFRHLVAYVMGEKKDEETGINHLAHCACCLLFLIWHDVKDGNK